MSEIKFDDDFFDSVDSFIDVANEKSGKIGPEKVGAALSYASARFNAFIVASSSVDLNQLKEIRDGAKKHFLPIYEKNFDYNLDMYEENYEKYINKFRKQSDS
jgi:hypothetical protein